MFGFSMIYAFVICFAKRPSLLLLILITVIKTAVNSCTTPVASMSLGINIMIKSTPLSSVKLGGLFISRLGPSGVDVIRMQEIAAFLMAVNEINNKTDSLSDWLLPETQIKYSLRLVDQNFQQITSSVLDLSSVVFNGDGIDTCIVGTTYNSQLQSALDNCLNTLSSVNIPLISSSLNYPLYNDKFMYPNFFRTVSSQSYQGYLTAKIISQIFGKTRISIFASDNKYCNYILEEFNYQSKLFDFTVASTHKITTQQVINSENQINNELIAAIKSCKSYHSEIFVFLINSPEIAVSLLKFGIQLKLFTTTTQIVGINEISNNATLNLIQKKLSNQNDVLGSFIGLQPVRNVTQQQLHFVKRWQQQQYQSNSIFSATTTYCINITDSDGHTIRKSYANNNLCNIFNINNINDISSEALNIYDAVYAFAHSTHNIIYNNNNKNITVSNMITANNLKTKIPSILIKNTSFSGISGTVSFSSGLNNIKKYGYGDRYTGQTYQLLHYSQNKLLCNGYWTDHTGYFSYQQNNNNEYLTIYPNFHYSNSPLLTNVPYRRVTYDGLISEVHNIPKYLQGIIMALAVLCMVIIVYYIRNVFKYSKIRILKASQPFMLNIILLGALFGCMYVIMSMLTPTTAICTLKAWFGHSAYFLVFGTLITKTWRINMIVNNGLKRVKVTKMHMGILIGSLISLLIFYLLLMTFVGKPFVYTSSSISGYHRMIETECRLEEPMVVNILYVLELLVLLLGLRVCYIARNMPQSVNETRYIVLAFYIVILLSVILYPLSILSLQLTVLEHIIFRQALMLVGIAATFIILYVPKAALLFGFFEAQENPHIVGGMKSTVKSNKRVSKIKSMNTEVLTSPSARASNKEKFAIDTPKKVKPKKLTAAEAAAIAARMKVMNMTSDLGAVHDFPTEEDVAACAILNTKKDSKSRSIESKPRGSKVDEAEAAALGMSIGSPNGGAGGGGAGGGGAGASIGSPGPPSPLIKKKSSWGNGLSSAVVSPLTDEVNNNNDVPSPVSTKCFETVARHANYRPSRDSIGKLTSFGEHSDK